MQPPTGKDTYIIVGLPRSGTSMIAGTLSKLGVYMGRRPGKIVFEDSILSAAVESGDPGQARQVIREYNEAHDRWAWKRPDEWRRLRKILPMFRNPRIVVTFRDILAIATRNEISVQRDVDRGIVRHARDYVEMLDVLDGVNCPVLMLSYEKCLLSPSGFLDELIAFCGLQVEPEKYAEALAFVEPEPASYLERARVHYVGQVAPIDGNQVSGWAAVSGRPGQHVTLELRVNGKVRSTTQANLEHSPQPGMPGKRSDYGFRLNIPRFTRSGARIDVAIPNSEIFFDGSGQIYGR